MPKGTETAAGKDNFVNNRIITMLKDLKERPPVARELYEPHPWTEGQGEVVEFDTSALTGLADTFAETQTITAHKRQEGNTLTKRQLQYGRAFEITKRMKKFNKFKRADSDAKKTTQAIKHGLDKDLTDQIFSQADNTSYGHRSEGTLTISCADSAAPASGSHVVVGTGSTNYDNRVNTTTGLPLSTDNFTTVKEVPNATMVDDEGTQIADAEYGDLVIAQNQDMKRKGRQLFGSQKEPEVFENAINIYNDGTHRLITLTRGAQTTTGAYNSALRYRWLVMAPEMKEMNQIQVAQEPDINLESVNENNLVVRVVADMFAAYACVGWQDKVYSLTTSPPA